ncbi:glutamine synthetase III, partial [Desulfococcaceae bacterium OttesenSCG-928-F15]|nr:glutamine synthetase III [Desulfococcaceae bacterium OttesenSCG-928-F15]
MSSTLRSAVRFSVATDTRIPEHPARHRPSDLFGKDVFGMEAMREHLPSAVFKRLEQAAHMGKSLDEGDADIIAGAMKDWAIERGATHYTHWFQPMTGSTAE